MKCCAKTLTVKTARRASLRRRAFSSFISSSSQIFFSAASIVISLLFPGNIARSQETTLRTQSNVVLIPALVKDSHGAIVYGLSAQDFIVEDDGVQLPVRLDETPEGQPISLVVAIQRGRRANYEFPRMQGLNSMLEPLFAMGTARVALLEFDSEVKIARNFTSDAALIAADLRNLEPGDDKATILDAVDYAVNLLKKEPEERLRVLLLISETRDHGSVLGSKMQEIVSALGNSNVLVYTLAFSPSLSNVLDTARGNNKDEMHPGPDLLGPILMTVNAMRKNVPKTIAEMTGGEYELFETKRNFELQMTDFTNHLHSRYLLSFVPKAPHPGLHEIRVRLRDRKETKGSTVLARTSYWAEGTKQ
jgi:VWFA-related protein